MICQISSVYFLLSKKVIGPKKEIFNPRFSAFRKGRSIFTHQSTLSFPTVASPTGHGVCALIKKSQQKGCFRIIHRLCTKQLDQSSTFTTCVILLKLIIHRSSLSGGPFEYKESKMVDITKTLYIISQKKTIY